MIENIGAYSQVDYDRGYKQAQTDTTTDCSDCEARIRAEVIEEFDKPVMNGTLHTICRMIASGDIPKDVYQKWLSDTPIGFMTPLEIYTEILNEQLKSQN